MLQKDTAPQHYRCIIKKKKRKEKRLGYNDICGCGERERERGPCQSVQVVTLSTAEEISSSVFMLECNLHIRHQQRFPPRITLYTNSHGKFKKKTKKKTKKKHVDSEPVPALSSVESEVTSVCDVWGRRREGGMEGGCGQK